MALIEKLTAIADAIRSKTGGTGELTLEQMATEIEGISTGGGAVSVPTKDVNFYDYDGTCLHSYTVAEAQALSELPALPEREGLICQGWNWSLEDIKAHNRALNVGATYTTDDGTTRIYIHLEEGRTSPMLGVCPIGTFTVDWGDGTEPDVLTGTSISKLVYTPNHNYAKAGSYVVRLTVDGSMAIQGDWGYTALLRHDSTNNKLNYAYSCSIQRVEVGAGVTNLSRYGFGYCYSLTTTTIPNSVTSITRGAFDDCSALKFMAIPHGIVTLDDGYDRCYSLTTVAIPNSVTTFNGSFQQCYSLQSFTIPNNTAITGYSTFNACWSLQSLVIPRAMTSSTSKTFHTCQSLVHIAFLYNVTSVDPSAFQYCYALKRIDLTHNTEVAQLTSTSLFSNVPADCEIRVPAALYDEWIAATNWSTYASQIVAV